MACIPRRWCLHLIVSPIPLVENGYITAQQQGGGDAIRGVGGCDTPFSEASTAGWLCHGGAMLRTADGKHVFVAEQGSLSRVQVPSNVRSSNVPSNRMFDHPVVHRMFCGFCGRRATATATLTHGHPTLDSASSSTESRPHATRVISTGACRPDHTNRTMPTEQADRTMPFGACRPGLTAL